MSFVPRSQATPLNLRQIEVFHAIMITGSLSEAGRMLCVSQPAVSRVLATAESRLKFLLFERVRGRLQPTPEARRLFSEVEPIISGVAHFNTVARSLAEGDEGKLCIVSSPSYSEWLMPRAIERFRARHPDVHISYRPMPFDALLPHMLLGRADLCISSMAPPPSANLVAKEIGQGNIMCAIPRRHPLASTEVITAAMLREQTLISYGSDTPFGQLTSRFLETADLSPHIEIRSTPEAMAMVRQGVGVALIESFGYTASLSDTMVLRPIAPALAHQIYQIHSRSNPLSNLGKGFLATLKNVLERELPENTPAERIAA
ncbi:LysR substrate-binding domain-containing protein [Xylophilus sp. GOD-11R]|uniref:LysR substrate-binding domain-containing protein n=1 Tax=Xylophilus sp. GOD-11R TaxID=3089814 RepID=UPI00298C7378|nr:LysR substrate-binding domain-containing protein [Xylophilus sp. GOD-11R]WPB56850.1 LysR substrate-binding domain-containing protein [Xylophilus sp. GOD-11R]